MKLAFQTLSLVFILSFATSLSGDPYFLAELKKAPDAKTAKTLLLKEFPVPDTRSKSHMNTFIRDLSIEDLKQLPDFTIKTLFESPRIRYGTANATLKKIGGSIENKTIDENTPTKTLVLLEAVFGSMDAAEVRAYRSLRPDLSSKTREILNGSLVSFISHSVLGYKKSKKELSGVGKMLMLTTEVGMGLACLLYTSPSPRDATLSRMPSSA